MSQENVELVVGLYQPDRAVMASANLDLDHAEALKAVGLEQ
jgi:hypothetical protein